MSVKTTWTNTVAVTTTSNFRIYTDLLWLWYIYQRRQTLWLCLMRNWPYHAACRV